MTPRVAILTAGLLLVAGGAAAAGQLVPAPTVTVSASQTTVPENPNQAAQSTTGATGPTFTVRIDVVLPVDITLPYSVSGSAINGRDYQSLSGRVTIRAGQTTGTITVSPIDDAEDEIDETVVVAMVSTSSSPYTVGRPGSATTTIIDDDDVRIIDASFVPDTVLGGRSRDMRVTLSGAAPAGGMAIRIQSGNAGVVADGQTTIAAGSRTGLATLGTSTVASTTTVPVRVTEPNGSGVSTALVVLTEPSVSRMLFRRSDTWGGGTISGSVVLDAPAPPGGLTLPVILSVQSPAGAALPAVPRSTIAFAGGSTSATLSVATQRVTTLTQVAVTVGSGAGAGTSTISVHPIPVVESVSAAPASVASTDSVDVTVRLTAAVPPVLGGWAAFVSGTGPVLMPADNRLPIPAGASETTIRLGTSSVAGNTEATVGVSDSPGGTVAGQARFTVTPPSVESLRMRGTILFGGSSSTGDVRLSAPAPPGGITVPITVSSPVAASSKLPVSAPASVTVPGGARYGIFVVETQPVTTSIEVQVTAGTAPASAEATLEIHPVPQVESITISPDPVGSGDSVTVRVHLDIQNLGGSVFALELAGSGPVDVPPNTFVLFRRYDQDARVRLGTASVPDVTAAEVYLQVRGTTVRNGIARFQVAPPFVTDVRFRPSRLAGGQSATGDVALSADAPPSGLTLPVALSSPTGGPVPATGPATVTVAPGSRYGRFTVDTQPVTSPTPIPVDVTVGHAPDTRTGTLEISQLPEVASVVVRPDPVEAGAEVAVSVQLNARNWIGSTLAFWVTGSGPVDIPPNTVILVQYGSDNGRVRIRTTDVTSPTTATINVSRDQTQPGPWTHSLSVVPAPLPSLSGVTVNPASVVGGSAVSVRVDLGSPVPAGRTASFPLSVTAPLIAPNASVIIVPEGQATATVTLQTLPVSQPTQSTVSVEAAQQRWLTATVNVEPEPAAPLTIAGLSAAPPDPIGGSEVELTATLSGPAGPGGYSATLSSSDPSLIPGPTIQVAAGQQTGTVRVRTSAVPAVRSVRLGVPGSPAANIALRPIPLERVQGPGSVRGGEEVSLEVRLLEPAPAGGLRVPLASSDATLAIVPAFVDVPAGAMSTSVRIQTRAGPTDTEVTITAGIGPGALSRAFRVRS